MIYQEKIKISTLIAIGLIFSLFLTCFYMRIAFMGSLANINYLFFLSLLLMVFRGKKIWLNGKELFLLLIMILHAAIINTLNDVSTKQIIYSTMMYFLPLIVVISEINPDSVLAKNLLNKLLKYFNFFVYIIFGIYVIDTLTNFAIMKLLTSTVIPGISDWVPNSARIFSYRYASFMGHYLMNALIYNMFYLLNMCYSRTHEKPIVNPRISMAICMIGVLSTGSKTGIFIMLISMFWFNSKGKNRIRNLILLIVCTLLLYYIGLFDLVFSRLSNESLTTGRNEVWNMIFAQNELKLRIFTGYGESIDAILTTMVGSVNTAIAKEYPFLILLYKFGFINVIGMLYFIVVKPCMKAIKNGNSFIAFSIIMIFIEINMFNGYLVVTDVVLLYLLFIMTLKLMDNKKIESN
ncbi:hypothetical protein [Neobacillus niacini]|uniref:hypothetical protein n=1 Tax=Neobacillus niacini TaxID=86668 RepID=UPI001C8E0CCF|nr:hypothetical protein [Neobacillus niacini]MBY0145120.1 hypothetical protein [Neobacillus niacini]